MIGAGLNPMITSKITSKAQTTIPQPVRTALRLKEGDEIAYAIEDGRVVLTRVESNNADDPFATFNEWDGDADRKAYGRL
jgi:antitoxin PrlF